MSAGPGMVELYPPIEPYAHGLLDVGDGNRVYWETCGNPHGKPALVVHGGPGSGCSTSMRQAFDPTRYRVVLFDQRGCGRSLPHGSDPATDMRCSTTHHLVRDMERLREHMGIERWLLHGGSWGSTLLLAYAQQHPRRVSEIVIASVTTTRHAEIRLAVPRRGALLPRGVAAVPGRRARGRARRRPARRLCALDGHPRPRGAERAAKAWCAWEDAVVSLEPNGKSNFYSDRPAAALLAFVRICAHYSAHGAWLEDGVVLREAGRRAGIPGVLIHARLDLSWPLDTAWELAQAWPDTELVVLNDSGHQASNSKRACILSALDKFARQ